MDFKYLNDGRKVAVIGKLNNEESIVQEIFVTQAGDEVPSGERFVAKSLHDSPVESYKTREEKRLNETLQNIKQRIDKASKEADEAKIKLRGYQDLVKSTANFVQRLPDSDLSILSAFVTGSVEYLVEDGYQITPPIKFMDAIIDRDSSWGRGGRYDGLKLLSVAGKSGGDFEYWLHRYSDGSGGHSVVKPFATYADAIAHIKDIAIERINSDRGLSKESYKACLKMGIRFPEEAESRYRAKRQQELERNIASLNETVQTKRLEIEAANKELEALQSATASED